MRFARGWTSVESAAGSVLLVSMQLDGGYAPHGVPAGLGPAGEDDGGVSLPPPVDAPFENPAFPAHMGEPANQAVAAAAAAASPTSR
eukprot:COSAG01_NODE_1144_length_11530_cov_4.888549_3_plen_87_part_00